MFTKFWQLFENLGSSAIKDKVIDEIRVIEAVWGIRVIWDIGVTKLIIIMKLQRMTMKLVGKKEW